jgi:hypothetical protein
MHGRTAGRRPKRVCHDQVAHHFLDKERVALGPFVERATEHIRFRPGGKQRSHKQAHLLRRESPQSHALAETLAPQRRQSLGQRSRVVPLLTIGADNETSSHSRPTKPDSAAS